MKWWKELTKPKCVCCGKKATKDVKDIPYGEYLLVELIKTNYLKVTQEFYDLIYYRFTHNNVARYPLCDKCYTIVEDKRSEDKVKEDEVLKQSKEDEETKKYYERLAIEIERKELELKAKSLGITME